MSSFYFISILSLIGAQLYFFLRAKIDAARADLSNEINALHKDLFNKIEANDRIIIAYIKSSETLLSQKLQETRVALTERLDNWPQTPLTRADISALEENQIPKERKGQALAPDDARPDPP